jgi:hypothetical protein
LDVAPIFLIVYLGLGSTPDAIAIQSFWKREDCAQASEQLMRESIIGFECVAITLPRPIEPTRSRRRSRPSRASAP